MYRVMVVEDSKPIVRDIVNKIRLVDPRITDIETSYDGESALNILQTVKPDILFADIKLPFIDGLTLIQKAKNIYPSLKCVVISGFGDFEFTHKALKLQVDEYILKPVDFGNFKKILTGLLNEIKQDTITRQEKTISEFLNNSRANVNNTGLPKNYMLSVARTGLIPGFSAILSKNEIYESLGMPASDGGIWVADTKFDCEKVILYDLDLHPGDEIKKLNENIYYILRKRHSQFNIILSEKLSDAERLDSQYTALSNSLSSMVVLNRPGTYFSSMSYGNCSPLKLNEEAAVFRKRMESLVRSKLPEDFQAELRRDIRAWEQSDYPVVFIRRFIMIFLEEIINSLADNDQLFIQDPSSQADRILSDCDSYRDLEAKLCEYYDLFINTRDERSYSPMGLAEKIEKYLRNNIYGNITMQDISDEFKLSPSYISRIMKMYYSNSPMDYYNKLKIKEAIKLMTEHREMLVKDIAEILGFSDQHYFSKVFKMQYGISPADFKNKNI